MGRIASFYHHHVALVHKAGFTALGLGVGSAAVILGQGSQGSDDQALPTFPDFRSQGSLDAVMRRASAVQEATKTLWHSLSLSGLFHAFSPTVQQIATWSADPSKRDALAALGGGLLLDWLLDRASESDARDTGQAAAENALVNLLYHRDVAGTLLAKPGAVPRLLNLLAHSSNPERLAEALTAAVGKAEMAHAALLEDIRMTIGLACPVAQQGGIINLAEGTNHTVSLRTPTTSHSNLSESVCTADDTAWQSCHPPIA